jgi:hypothetical protein
VLRVYDDINERYEGAKDIVDERYSLERGKKSRCGNLLKEGVRV